MKEKYIIFRVDLDFVLDIHNSSIRIEESFEISQL